MEIDAHSACALVLSDGYRLQPQTIRLRRFQGAVIRCASRIERSRALAATATDVNRNIVREVQPAGAALGHRQARCTHPGERAHQRGRQRPRPARAANSAGRATGQSVIATLICEAATPFVRAVTAPAGVVAVSGRRFQDRRHALARAAFDCASPMLPDPQRCRRNLVRRRDPEHEGLSCAPDARRRRFRWRARRLAPRPATVRSPS